MPTVTVDCYLPGSGADGVIPDYRRGAFECVSYLIGKGHERISLISAERSAEENCFAQLYDGARRAREDAGLRAGRHLVAGLATTPEEGHALASKLLKLPKGQRPTALVGSDYAVLGALRAAHDLEVRVPEQLALVGVDDIELSRYSVPRLSTVKVDKELLARIAVERLLWRLGRPEAPQCRLTIDCPLILRDTC